MKKLFLKLIILVSTFGFTFLLFSFNSKVSAASLIINPPFGSIASGKDLSVDVVIKGQDELVDGVDANIAYDSNFLKVKEMKKGSFFSDYPIFKDDNGQVKITALAPSEGVKIFGDIIVATLVFEIQDSGDTKLTIAYEDGTTSESNVAQHGTAKDLLTQVTSGSYKVEATPEKLQAARAKRAKQSGLIPILIFIVLIIIVGFGIWYYKKKKKTSEEYFVPEAFPMDEVPKESGSGKDSSSSPPSPG